MTDAAQFDVKMSAQQQLQHCEWYPLPHPEIAVRGLAFYADEGCWCRLPQALKPPLLEQRPAVWTLAEHTAGASLHFVTDSREIWVSAKLTGAPYMSHMTAVAQCGFDCYLRPEGTGAKDWIFAGASKFPLDNDTLCCCLATALPATRIEVQINLPLYIGVQSIAVGLFQGALLWGPPAAQGEKVAFYGTSITQGGCATRSGMAYPAILQRRLALQCYNFGFSGNGVGLPLLAGPLCGIKSLRLLVVDIELNAGPEGLLEKNLPAFLDEVRRLCPALAVLVLSAPFVPQSRWNPHYAAERSENRLFQQQEVLRRQQAGDRNIHFADESQLLGDNAMDATVDGVHLTDLGFSAMADALTPVIRQILGR